MMKLPLSVYADGGFFARFFAGAAYLMNRVRHFLLGYYITLFFFLMLYLITILITVLITILTTLLFIIL